MDVESQKPRDLAVPSITYFVRLQASIEAALLFIQQAVEQDDGRLQFRRPLRSQGRLFAFPRRRATLAPPPLFPRPARLPGRIYLPATPRLAVSALADVDPSFV